METPVNSKAKDFYDARKNLLQLVSDSDNYGIDFELTALFFRLAVIEISREARRLGSDGDESIGFNPLVCELLEEGYAALQMMSIRRLVDKRKDVNSLYRIVRRIEKDRGLWTRENYVSLGNIPYDTRRLEEERDLWLEKNIANTGGATFLPSRFKAIRVSRERHETFDQFCGSTPDTRSADDVLRQKFIKDLITKLDGSERITQQINDHLAHSKDRSHPHYGGDFDIKVGELIDTIKSLREVASCVFELLQCSDAPLQLTVYQGDVAEGFDRAWASPSDLDAIRDKWFEIEDTLAGWQKGVDRASR